MDFNTTNQEIIPANNTPELKVNSNSDRHRFIYVIISGLVTLFVLVGAIYYFRTHITNPAPQLKPTKQLETPITSATLSPTPSFNLQSQTYTNTDKKIAFKYPSNWIVKYKDTKYPMTLCDLNKVNPSLAPTPGIKYGACEASDITPTVSLTFSELLDIYPQSALTANYGSNSPIQLNYYENPDNLTIQEFNNKYLSGTVAGDSVGMWSQKYEQVTNDNKITAFYDKEHYCVAMCQVYVFSGKGKIFILKNFPTNVPDQLTIFEKVFSSIQIQ